MEYVEKWFEEDFECAMNNVICGDFNVDLMKKKNTSYAKRLIKLMQFYGVKQIITEPTRITEYSKSKIDLVMTNGSVTVKHLF